jgi:hypothetical protein
MGQAIGVRTDFMAGEVRRFGKRAKDAAQARRLPAIAAVFEGASRKDAARVGGMNRQTLRWVIRFLSTSFMALTWRLTSSIGGLLPNATGSLLVFRSRKPEAGRSHLPSGRPCPVTSGLSHDRGSRLPGTQPLNERIPTWALKIQEQSAATLLAAMPSIFTQAEAASSTMCATPPFSGGSRRELC